MRDSSRDKEEFESILRHAMEQAEKDQWWNALWALKNAQDVGMAAFDGFLKRR